MKFLRTLSTRSLVVVMAAVAVLAAGGTAIAIAAGGTGPAPAAKPLAQALHDGLAAPPPDGITARIHFTNRLFPSGLLEGRAGSALMTGASGRLWLTNGGRGRLELQSTAGDAQLVWNRNRVTLFDASSNTVYSARLPGGMAKSDQTDSAKAPSVARIGELLSKLGQHAGLSPAQPTNVAHQPAYTVSVTPKESGGLVGSLQLAWDAARGIPLRVAVYARGATKPILALEATNIRYGAVPAANVDVAPPASAKHVDLGAPGASDRKDGAKGKHAAGPSGLSAVKAAARFPVTAPDHLAGLKRSAVRLVGKGDHKAVLVVYGEGLGAIAVLERGGAASAGGQLGGLPAIPLDGVQAHELTTPLGTILEWRRGDVSYVLAGSIPSAAAESAAHSLR